MTEQSVKVQVLKNISLWDMPMEIMFQTFYLPKIGDRIDGIFRKHMETLENNKDGEWGNW